VTTNARRSSLWSFAALALGASCVSAKTTPVAIDQTVAAQFPAALSFSTITSGEARVLINIDADGKLVDLLVTGFSHPAFADEAVSLLRHWKYTPAKVDDQPVGVRLELQINFVTKGRVISLPAIDTVSALLKESPARTFVHLVCPPGELDRPVEVKQTVTPLYPGTTGAAGGTTVLDFYVDEHGLTRMPAVLSASDSRYAAAAISALSGWRFAAPTRHGRPVAVRVQQSFVFPAVS